MGSKTIGVAVSDELGLIAHGRETIRRQDLKRDLQTLDDLVQELGVDRVVVGLPINMTGTLGPEAEKVLQFVEEMKRTLSVAVITWDERLTTVQAERVLLQAGLTRKKRKRVIDKAAATVILQTYLDAERSREVS
jgi:putative Holliday junction resolvase